jgi:hypothetical protein
MMRSIVCAVLVSAIVTSVGAQSDRAYAWSLPSRVPEAGAAEFLQYPSVVFANDTMLVVANRRTDATDGPSLLLFSIPGGRLPLPNIESSFAYPELLRDSSGAYHLLWSEYVSPRASRRAGDGLRSLWHARLVGHRWSRPRKILEGQRLSWESQERRAVTVGRTGLQLVLPAVLDSGRLVLALLRLEGETWHATFLDAAVTYASVAAISRDSVAVAYMGADLSVVSPSVGSSIGTSNSIYVRRSYDGGRTWGDAQQVEGAISQPRTSLTLLYADSSLHLGWTEATRENGGAVSFRYRRAAEGGNGWSHTVTGVMKGSVVRSVFAFSCKALLIVSELLYQRGTDIVMALHQLRFPVGPATSARMFTAFDIEGGAALARERNGFRIVFAAIGIGSESPAVFLSRTEACEDVLGNLR